MVICLNITMNHELKDLFDDDDDGQVGLFVLVCSSTVRVWFQIGILCIFFLFFLFYFYLDHSLLL